MIPCSKLNSYGDHTFSVSLLKLWNNIPETIKCRVDLNVFKRNLKLWAPKLYHAKNMSHLAEIYRLFPRRITTEVVCLMMYILRYVLA